MKIMIIRDILIASTIYSTRAEGGVITQHIYSILKRSIIILHQEMVLGGRFIPNYLDSSGVILHR